MSRECSLNLWLFTYFFFFLGKEIFASGFIELMGDSWRLKLTTRFSFLRFVYSFYLEYRR